MKEERESTDHQRHPVVDHDQADQLKQANVTRDRLDDHRRAFEERADVVTLREGWLPKSQLIHVARQK